MKIVRKISMAAVVIIIFAAIVHTDIPDLGQTANSSGWRRGKGSRGGGIEGLKAALP
jgi:hypothetical protein